MKISFYSLESFGELGSQIFLVLWAEFLSLNLQPQMNEIQLAILIRTEMGLMTSDPWLQTARELMPGGESCTVWHT